MKPKDKRFTLNQVMGQVHEAYDHFELAAKKALKEEFGFGPERMRRFEERFSEISAAECERIRGELRKKQLK